MCGRRCREWSALGGELVRWVFAQFGVQCANPWEARPAESEALREHREKWSQLKWRGMVDACRER